MDKELHIENMIKEALADGENRIELGDILLQKAKHRFKTENKRKISLRWPVIAVMIFAIMSCGIMANAKGLFKTDKIEYPFVDDSQVTGRWQSVDFVKSISEFSPDKKLWTGDLYLNELAFTKTGGILLSLGKGNLTYAPMTWTKGIIINSNEKTASKYQIKEIDGTMYMFYEWKSGDYIFREIKPKYYVLKKVDNSDYSNKEIARKTDKIDYAFVDDPQVIGKWQSIDLVKVINKFDPDKPSFIGDLYLNELAFIKGGRMLSSFEKENLAYSSETWTKGVIIDSNEKTASKYEIKEISGSKYMFYEWKSSDYIFRGMQPEYFVLKKVDNADYSNWKVTRKTDKIDYPFVDDPQVVGEWQSIDFVETIDKFSLEKRNSLIDLYLTNLTFKENGKLTGITTKGNTTNSVLSWTKGIVIDAEEKTASKYEIKEINGSTYMFFEWKSGDYVFRELQPKFYVLKKVK